jgi:hypothetical protein
VMGSYRIFVSVMVCSCSALFIPCHNLRSFRPVETVIRTHLAELRRLLEVT